MDFYQDGVPWVDRFIASLEGFATLVEEVYLPASPAAVCPTELGLGPPAILEVLRNDL